MVAGNGRIVFTTHRILNLLMYHNIGFWYFGYWGSKGNIRVTKGISWGWVKAWMRMFLLFLAVLLSKFIINFPLIHTSNFPDFRKREKLIDACICVLCTCIRLCACTGWDECACCFWLHYVLHMKYALYQVMSSQRASMSFWVLLSSGHHNCLFFTFRLVCSDFLRLDPPLSCSLCNRSCFVCFFLWFISFFFWLTYFNCFLCLSLSLW